MTLYTADSAPGRTMSTLYPFTFTPIFMQRVWGGRNIERLYGKPLPADQVIGESWEITDRPEGVSVIANGPLAGKTLRWLMENHPGELLGADRAGARAFPLLVKILDAQDRLSLQVHPPATIAADLAGEPKTEMWFIASATPSADLFVGLKRGVTREAFARKVRDGTVADCFHRIAVKAGDTMFLPSGRVHAIGAGNVIFEIQQNSDTTYRVFDWNRLGLDGQPRELHIEQSMASIDFEDFEPSLVQASFASREIGAVRQLVNDPLFRTSAWQLTSGQHSYGSNGLPQIVGIVRGRLTLSANGVDARLGPGDFCLIPASIARLTVRCETDVELLHVEF